MEFTLETKIGPVDVVPAQGDLPAEIPEHPTGNSWVGIDTETSGLDWSVDQLGLVQVYLPAIETVYLIRPHESIPSRLVALLESSEWTKAFHFAMFDLRFLAGQWELTPSNIRCTKIASKLLSPKREKHSLANLIADYFDVELTKDRSVRVSDWTAEQLTRDQLSYAALDAVYLPELFQQLQSKLEHQNRSALASRCFSFLPTQLQADLLGIDDLFGY